MRLNPIECDFEAPICNSDCSIDRNLDCNIHHPLACLAETDLLDEINALYCDKDHNNGKVPDKGESDESDDSGKPIPNPMPDDLDEPLQLKHHHQHYFGHHYILYTCL
ncbi:MAG: hypothetical protein H7Z20_03065 [Bdellovibrio sp.]|nr:hypothetical protein [Methylotenera sp.]